MRSLATSLLLTAVLLAPVAAAGPTICMALECNPVYKVQKIVEDTVGDPNDLLQWCQAEQCRPGYYVGVVTGIVGDVVVLP